MWGDKTSMGGSQLLELHRQHKIGISFFIIFISDLIYFFSQFGSQSHPYFFNYPPPPPRAILRSNAYTSSLAAQRGSSDPESDTPSSSRILSPICRNSRCPFLMRLSKLLSPPPSFGVTSQLCHSIVSRPNSI